MGILSHERFISILLDHILRIVFVRLLDVLTLDHASEAVEINTIAYRCVLINKTLKP